MRDYEKLFKTTKKEKLSKLERRAYKGDFPIDIKKLHTLLLFEVAELTQAIHDGNIDEILDESVDVSLYADMLTLACDSIREKARKA